MQAKIPKRLPTTWSNCFMTLFLLLTACDSIYSDPASALKKDSWSLPLFGRSNAAMLSQPGRNHQDRLGDSWNNKQKPCQDDVAPSVRECGFSADHMAGSISLFLGWVAVIQSVGTLLSSNKNQLFDVVCVQRNHRLLNKKAFSLSTAGSLACFYSSNRS
jgi:hypothetical protein